MRGLRKAGLLGAGYISANQNADYFVLCFKIYDR